MSKPLACIIVDDEPLAIEVMESYVKQFESLRLLSTFQNPIKAFEYIRNHSVDLIFMDIQMPKLTGLDILRSLPNRPKVIITTAYRDYALEGFELEVTDYLLKPVSFERFVRAVGKVENGRSQASAEDITENIFVKVEKKMVRVDLFKVYYLESQRDYLKIILEDGEVVTHMAISEAERIFPADRFFRAHRSFIVARDRIDSFSTNEIQLGNHAIPIGRNYRSTVLKILNNLAGITRTV